MFRWSKKFTNTPIVFRLFLAFAWATIIPTIVILFLSNTYFNALYTEGQAVQVSNQAIKVTTNELAHLQSMHALLTALLPSITTNATEGNDATVKGAIAQVLDIEGSFDINTVNYQAQYQLATSDMMADVRTILKANGQGALITRQQALLDNILAHQWPQYKTAQDNLLIGLDINTRLPLSDATALLQKADELYTPVLNSWQEIVNIAVQVNTQVVKVGPSKINPILFGTIAAVLFSMIIVFGIGYFVNRTITRPLRQLTVLTKRIVSGETTARAELEGNDEIARVGSSMNTMLDHMVQLMQETQTQRDGLQGQVEQFISEVRGVGSGDLSVRAQTASQALGLLARSFNYMIDQLSSLVIRVKKVSLEVEYSTSTMLEHTSSLVRVGDLQIRQIVETTASVERLARSSHEVAERARRLHNITSETTMSVQRGRQSILQAIDEVGDIQKNVQATAKKVQVLGEISQEIDNIVAVISGIAYQTNRLALDSAIQSAIAGPHGKGFGAVAANIRSLAEQTKDQASMIARIVRSIREDIATTASSMQNTEYEVAQEVRVTRDIGEALNEIFSVVERQAEGAATINQMANQQLQSANTIVQTMHHVSDTTRQNNEHTSNASQLMEHLAQLVGQLRASVAVFKLREDAPRAGTAALGPGNPSFAGRNRSQQFTSDRLPPIGNPSSGEYNRSQQYSSDRHPSSANQHTSGIHKTDFTTERTIS